MLFPILFKGIYFALPYSTQRWNVYAAGKLRKIKMRKMKHAYNKDKTLYII